MPLPTTGALKEFAAIVLPLGLDEDCNTTLLYGAEALRDIIESCVLTAVDEIPLYENFGTPVLEGVFEPKDGALTSYISVRLRDTAARFLRGVIEIMGVEVDASSDDEFIYVKIHYLIVSSKKEDTSVIRIAKG